MNKPIIIIPARMASTRLPDKPLADIAGKPMIQHVWEKAIQADIGKVIVACDNEKVLNIITSLGGIAIMTSQDHLSGTDRILEALVKFENNHQKSL